MSRAMATQTLLPADAAYDRLDPTVPGPTRAEDFESWEQEDDHPLELIGGWVLPMSPGNADSGRSWGSLHAALLPIVKARGWDMTLDALHRLPRPQNTVVYPDIAIHTTRRIEYRRGTETVGRVPDLIVDLLGKRTCERDVAPHGAKFLAYQMSGVREYYYTWPDGREASGFTLRRGVYVPLLRDRAGFFRSPLLGCALRLVEAATKPA